MKILDDYTLYKKMRRERKEEKNLFLPALFEIHILPTVRRTEKQERKNSKLMPRWTYKMFQIFWRNCTFFVSSLFHLHSPYVFHNTHILVKARIDAKKYWINETGCLSDCRICVSDRIEEKYSRAKRFKILRQLPLT